MDTFYASQLVMSPPEMMGWRRLGKDENCPPCHTRIVLHADLAYQR